MENVKVLGIAGSPRHGNTDFIVKEALKAVSDLGGTETEFVSLADHELKPCESCYLCYGIVKGATEEEICYKHKDVDPIVRKMVWADGIVVGSPVYAWNMSARLKCLMEKCVAFCPALCTEVSYGFRNKIVGAVVVGGGIYDGPESVAQSIWRWAIALGMIVVGSVTTAQDPFPESSLLGGLTTASHSMDPYGPDAVRAEKTATTPPLMGELNMRAVRNLGRNVAVVTKIVQSGLKQLKEEGVDLPEIGLFKTLPVEPAPNSFMARLVKEGKLQIVK